LPSSGINRDAFRTEGRSNRKNSSVNFFDFRPFFRVVSSSPRRRRIADLSYLSQLFSSSNITSQNNEREKSELSERAAEEAYGDSGGGLPLVIDGGNCGDASASVMDGDGRAGGGSLGMIGGDCGGGLSLGGGWEFSPFEDRGETRRGGSIARQRTL
jgi:hypothetical protein